MRISFIFLLPLHRFCLDFYQKRQIICLEFIRIRYIICLDFISYNAIIGRVKKKTAGQKWITWSLLMRACYLSKSKQRHKEE